jgi:transposase-like protein
MLKSETHPRKVRRIYTSAQRAKILEQSAQSKKNPSDFCKGIGLSVSALYRWQRESSAETESAASIASEFVEVSLPDVDTTIEIELANGIKLMLRSSGDLRSILEVLQTC